MEKADGGSVVKFIDTYPDGPSGCRDRHPCPTGRSCHRRTTVRDGETVPGTSGPSRGSRGHRRVGDWYQNRDSTAGPPRLLPRLAERNHTCSGVCYRGVTNDG